jgi:hypothetical protein
MRKLKGKINGRMITRRFFPEFVGMEGEINCGDCYRWAYIAYKLYKDVELWTNKHHAFPLQGNLFFDSESPDGVDDAQDLVCNCMCGLTEEDSFSLTVKKFENYWAKNGSFVDREVLDCLIAEFWKQFDTRNRKNRKNNKSHMKRAA